MMNLNAEKDLRQRRIRTSARAAIAVGLRTRSGWTYCQPHPKLVTNAAYVTYLARFEYSA